MKIAGQPVPHESAAGHVSGDALYTDDLCGRFPGILHAWPVIAPHAHALLTRLDAAPALQEPGVATVLTGEDVLGEGDSGCTRHDEPLFPTEVMYHSQPVAWVLGETLEAARKGASRVIAEYEPLPALLTVEDAIAASSFHSGPVRVTRGDPTVIEKSALQFSGEFAIGGQEHFYLETQCAISWLDETGGMAVECSTQHPAETQDIVARVLGIARNQVMVGCLRMGGAFGGKEVQANAWAAIAALGTWKTKRPVRVRLTRALDMALTGKRHPFVTRYTAGFAQEGRLEGVRIEFYSDGGWSLDLSDPVLARAIFHADNTYLLPAADLTGYVCRTHKTSQTAFRGFGGPQGMLVIEDIMDQAARRLGLPPEVVRERNFYREGDVTHYGQTVKDADRIQTIWTQLLRCSGFAERRANIQRFNAEQPHRKRGLAITPVKFGISFTATMFNQAGALVMIYRDGSVQVNHGGTEMGQGLHTKIGQIAAQGLGVLPEAIRVMPTRTDKVPNTSATAASAGADLNGAAVLNACTQLQERLTAVAAGMLKCDAVAVRFSDGQVYAEGAEAESVLFRAVCEAAYRERIALFAQGYYRTPEIHYDAATLRGRPFYYYVYGAAVSEVELDGFTGDSRLLRVDILEDAGTSLSPIVDRGQIEGGFIQGAGWMTIEELLWDAQGRVATAGASTYKLPSWSEMPAEFNVNFLERAAEPGVVFGSKAVGEPPLMLAISVREAIRDAVAAFGNGGPVALALPATPEKIFFAIRRARRDSQTPANGVASRKGQRVPASMSAAERGEILRASLFHTPQNPFLNGQGLESHQDGGLLIRAGKIAESGEYSVMHAAHPNVPVTDLRGGFLLPGFIDTHTHFPQLRVLGGLGRELLDWLEYFALPEEARMADDGYACQTAQGFVRSLAAHGTTTALVFGAHFASATASLFEAAAASGLRIVSGMVVSDRRLRPELHQTPQEAYSDSTSLIRRFHGHGRLLYAVTPRFALSASEAMLEVCQTLLNENSGVRFQTHLNENRQEIAEVKHLFPWASDYLNVYERFELAGSRSVMAHNVHPSDSELERLAAGGTSISHCPCSNAALGSGIFPLRRHMAAGVKCALGTDVGGGTGFGMLKEGLQAYLAQRLAVDGALLIPAHLLYLATHAGAVALGMEEEIGDFSPGKSADLVYLRPPRGSPLEAVVEQADSMDRILAALFTLGGSESVREVRVEGSVVYRAPEA